MNDQFLQKLPSKVTSDYWVYAYRQKGEYPEHTLNGGKWLIFVSDYFLDKIWIKIKTATEEGKLGGMVKVATAKTNPDFQNSKVKVVCVYTYDWKDKMDVKRVRDGLRNIGITRKIAYKTDEDTDQNKYKTNNSERLSKYYE